MTETHDREVAAPAPVLADEKLLTMARRAPLTALPGTSLADCIALIQTAGTGDSVFVIDDEGHLEGVLTERDIFARLIAADVDLERPVESEMIEHPWTLDLDQPVRHAIELMQTGRYRNVPLVDDEGRLAGVVRPVDVLKFLAESFPEQLLNLPPRPHQRIEATEGA